MVNFLYILGAFALVLLNAFFVAAEFGMVKLRHTRVEAIKDQYGLRGKILENIHLHLDAYLSACQLGITLASLGLGWVGEPAFAELLESAFELSARMPQNVITFSAFFIAFTFISFLHIVIGELVPKSFAIRQSERVSLWTAIPLYVFYWMMYPAIWLLNQCSNFILRLAGLSETHKGERTYSPEEIKLILTSSHLHGELTKEEVDILEHTLDFTDLKIIEIMRPLNEMVYLHSNQTFEEQLSIIYDYRYSRYPIFDDSKQKFIGIIHVKDLFLELYKERKISDLTQFIRPLLKVFAHTPALDTLKKFREGASHFALIYNEVDEAIGFITLDNLLLIIVGRIKDEFHKTEYDWTTTKDGAILMNGNSSLYSLERALDIDLPETDAHTLSGLILSEVGTLPGVGDKIEFEQFTAIIETMKGTRILKVKIYPKS